MPAAVHEETGQYCVEVTGLGWVDFPVYTVSSAQEDRLAVVQNGFVIACAGGRGLRVITTNLSGTRADGAFSISVHCIRLQPLDARSAARPPGVVLSAKGEPAVIPG